MSGGSQLAQITREVEALMGEIDRLSGPMQVARRAIKRQQQAAAAATATAARARPGGAAPSRPGPRGPSQATLSEALKAVAQAEAAQRSSRKIGAEWLARHAAHGGGGGRAEGRGGGDSGADHKAGAHRSEQDWAAVAGQVAGGAAASPALERIAASVEAATGQPRSESKAPPFFRSLPAATAARLRSGAAGGQGFRLGLIQDSLIASDADLASDALMAALSLAAPAIGSAPFGPMVAFAAKKALAFLGSKAAEHATGIDPGTPGIADQVKGVLGKKDWTVEQRLAYVASWSVPAAAGMFVVAPLAGPIVAAFAAPVLAGCGWAIKTHADERAKGRHAP